MSIIKQDCLTLLYELKDDGVSCDEQIKQLLRQKTPDESIIKFINDHKELECRSFYEKLRRSYNDKRSQLYKNIVSDDINSVDVLTCLASLNLQILLFTKNVDNLPVFLRQIRFEEIQRVMLYYAQTNDIIPCQKLLKLFKADLKCLEELSKN